LGLQTSFEELREQYSDYFARAAALYNVSPLLGRLYAYLLLSPEPMSLGELAETAGAAKSTVSVVMRTLDHYRLVRRHWVKGDRRDYFTARTDSGVILQELFDLFFSRELKFMESANLTARQALETVPFETDWPDKQQRLELLERLTQFESFISLVSGWLKQIVGNAEPITPTESIPIEVEK